MSEISEAWKYASKYPVVNQAFISLMATLELSSTESWRLSSLATMLHALYHDGYTDGFIEGWTANRSQYGTNIKE